MRFPQSLAASAEVFLLTISPAAPRRCSGELAHVLNGVDAPEGVVDTKIMTN